MKGHAVVDASLAVKWLVSEIHSDKAFALARSWVSDEIQLAAPYLMPVEVSNALHRRVARNELTVGIAARLMETLMASGIEFWETAYIHSKAIEMASRFRQNATYDAHYLALAETLNCELVDC